MIKTIIKENLYLDSVFLMTAGKEVKNVNGIRNAVLVMGTELNKSVLEELGALTPEAKAATANSLILSLDVEQEGAEEEALAALEALINGKSERQSDEEKSYSSLDAALEAEPETNLTVISVAGEFAGEEARKALHRGSHVFLFSDNVPLEEEIELKTYAREHGLLVMGPGCGTSVIGGISIGLMSKVSQGGIGIVAASGSGLQEVAMLADRMGEGISQAIGTGGRDLSREVGGITMLQGIELLRDDPETKVIVLVSKPPHPETSRKIYDAVRQIEKPVVIFFLAAILRRSRTVAPTAPRRLRMRQTRRSLWPGERAFRSGLFSKRRNGNCSKRRRRSAQSSPPGRSTFVAFSAAERTVRRRCCC